MAGWWFVTWSTYGWWLPGDARGFRTRRGREYVPPPARYAKAGEPIYDPASYAGRWKRARQACPTTVTLTADEQHLGLRAVVGDMKQLPLVPRILSFGKNHIHFVAQFGALKIRPTV